MISKRIKCPLGWVEGFVVQFVRIVLETVRQELERDSDELASYMQGIDAGTKDRQQTTLDEHVAGIIATHDTGGPLAMHGRTIF